MNTRLLKKIKKRYVYFWHKNQLHSYDKKKQEVVHKNMSTQYWMIRNACGPFTAEKFLKRIYEQATKRPVH